MSLTFMYLIEAFLYAIGFIIFVIVLPLLIALIIWIIGKMNSKYAITKKKMWGIAYIPSITIFLLLSGTLWSEKYISTGIGDLGDVYGLSLPLNVAYSIDYPNDWNRGDDYGEIKHVKFFWKIPKKTINKLDILCEQTKQMENSLEGVICQYPEANNKQNEQMNFNPKGYPRGWSKEGGNYYYCAEYGTGCYYFFFDLSTNSAITQYYHF